MHIFEGITVMFISTQNKKQVEEQTEPYLWQFDETWYVFYLKTEGKRNEMQVIIEGWSVWTWWKITNIIYTN